MKTTIRLFLLGLFFVLITSCGEDNDPGTPLVPVTEAPMTGLLGTIGFTVSSYSEKDTLVYHKQRMIGFVYYEESATEKVVVAPQGDGIWSIKRVNPIINQGEEYMYFGCEPRVVSGADFYEHFAYIHKLRSSFTPDCEFNLIRDEDNPKLFYLESKLYPDYYLTSARYNFESTAAERYLLYSANRRAFFILTN